MQVAKGYELQARLSPSSGTAALLRLLSVLHSRTDEVLELNFDAVNPGGPLVIAEVTMRRESPESLQSWLERLVEVVEVRVSERRPITSR